MDIAPANMPSDELRAAIEAAQADLAQAADLPSMRKDPVRLVLMAISGTLGVLGRSTTRWERAVADVIAARDPMTEEDRAALIAAVEDGAYRGMRKEAQRMVRTLDSKLSVQIGLGAVAVAVVSVMATVAFLAVTHTGPYSLPAETQAAWHDLMVNNPDPRPVIASAEIRADRAGRRYYTGLQLWIDPARPPPR